jgi:tetratricopeptide (TPR) repeat protein
VRRAGALGGLVLLLATGLAGEARGDAEAAAEALRAADDLADLKLADEALEGYREALKLEPRREQAKRAWYGVARCALLAGEPTRAVEAWRELARRFPEEAARVLFLRLDEARAHWAFGECLEILGEIEARGDLEDADRARALAARAAIEPEVGLAPALESHFEEPLGDTWIVTDPARTRWNRARRDVEVRLGAEPGPSPFGPPALAAAVPWRGEPCRFTAGWKVLDMEPGAVARIGLLAEAPTAGAEPRAAAADRLVLELAARAEDGFAGDGAAPRRYAVSLVAETGGERVERAAPAGEAGLALDVWYEARVDYAPDPPRVRVEVDERSAESGAAEARPRTVFRAELPLGRRLAEGDWVLGLLAPSDAPEGAPATVLVRELGLVAPPGVAARPLPPHGDGASADFFRGTAALASGRAAEAALAFRRAAEASPFLDAALFGEGLAARDSGELVEAGRAFAAIVRTTPRAREEFRRVAVELRTRASREDLKSLLEADLPLEAYVEVDPDDAFMRAAVEEARRRLGEALDREAQGAADLGAARQIERGRLYLRARQPPRALAAAEAAVASAGEAPAIGAAALVLRGDARAALGDAPLAAIDYMRAGRLDATNPDPRIALARLFLAARAPAGGGERPEAAAEALLLRGEWLARDRAEVFILRAQARLAQGKLAGAREDAERAIALAPRAVAAHAALAEAALREGRKEEARAVLARARRLGPVDPALEAAARRAE